MTDTRAKSTVRRIRARLTRRVVLGLALCLVASGTAALVPLMSDDASDDRTPQQGTRTVAAPKPTAREHPKGGGSPEEDWDGKIKILGDGSTSYTGPQPAQLKAERLKPGERPPQFVVFSWDGALEGDDHLFSRFAARRRRARPT